MIPTINKVLHIKNEAMLIKIRSAFDQLGLSHDLYFHKLQPEMNYIYLDEGVYINGSIEPNEEEIEFDEFLNYIQNDSN